MTAFTQQFISKRQVKTAANIFITRKIVTVYALLGLSLALPVIAQPSAEEIDSPSLPALTETTKSEGVLPLDDLRMFAKVYNHIRQGYVEDISDEKLLEYAIKGMLSELDPHSSYLDSRSFEDLQENTTGEFGGLGIEIGMENGFVKIISPIDDTPASRAGVEAGDLIIKLDDKPVKGMSISDAVSNMRGPIGSDIRLMIVREGVDLPFELILTRDTIKVTSVRTRDLEPGYGYLRISQFQLDTGKEVVTAIEKIKKNNPDLKGLILDLRNNPGGVLQASVEAADAFLNDGLIVYTEGRIANADIQYKARPGDVLNGLPIVVLINDGSASASEIVAGALQDQHRAIIVGTESFGKGSVQTVIPISDERAIKMTTALYFTPSGRSIQAQGIKPDIFVERATVKTIKQQLRTTEADLANHLGNGNGGNENGSSKRDKKQNEKISLSEQDNQLYEALNLLKGVHLFGQHNLPIHQKKSTIAKNEENIQTTE
ncbi:MAG: S41 family peptidase [Cellvibrionaceae bacterium]